MRGVFACNSSCCNSNSSNSNNNSNSNSSRNSRSDGNSNNNGNNSESSDGNNNAKHPGPARAFPTFGKGGAGGIRFPLKPLRNLPRVSTHTHTQNQPPRYPPPMRPNTPPC